MGWFVFLGRSGGKREIGGEVEADGGAVGFVELEDFGPEAGAGLLVGGAVGFELWGGGVALLELGFELVDALVEEVAELADGGRRSGGGELEEVGDFGEGGDVRFERVDLVGGVGG